MVEHTVLSIEHTVPSIYAAREIWASTAASRTSAASAASKDVQIHEYQL